MNLSKIYNALQNVHAQPAVSIFVPSHRTSPDNQQDGIALKNALSELEDRLNENYDKREAQAILDQIDLSLKSHDHNYNLDTIAIFATAEEAHVFRFPFQTVARIVVNDQFALREIQREINNGVDYYALVISRDNARLIEAYNDTAVHEFDHNDEIQNLAFPIKNDVSGAGDRSDDRAEENAFKEFLNRVDKSVQEIYHQSPLPVFIVGDTRTVSIYEQVCDNTQIIAGKVTNSSDLDAEARILIEEIQQDVHDYRNEQQKIALEKVGQAKGQDLLLNDIQTIYAGAVEGRISDLFIRKGYVQPAQVNTETLNVLITDDEAKMTTDDIVADIIDLTIQNGGQTHFISPELFPEEENLLAVARY
ncbi:AOC03_06830 family ribosome hibernation factor [Acinetobacter shaoyimingii]|uniref:Uncharacterized protein n=1 Tax=Acinetobacter shaoyimingii TaxID=2715164 RepID=A0A6G8RVZ2_9GAMM|nr:hypothetical protein [Acinetobacter shaoyimingii]QIO06112.1 hypothetical protein G8E00_09165 [Acinetobacter shaoyimingii]